MKHSAFTPSPKWFELDLNNLLHPAQAYAHPRDVVHDPDLTVNEKRAVLASWASDACAVEAAPTLRCAPGACRAVAVDGILEALRALDMHERTKREVRRRTFDVPAAPSAYPAGLRKRAVELRIPTPREAPASHM